MKEERVAEDPLQALARGFDHELARLRHEGAAKLLAIVVLAVLLAASAAMNLYQAIWARPTLYVIEVDDAGNVAYGGELGTARLAGDEYVASQLVGFIERWRTVTPDNTMGKRFVTSLYCMVPGSVPAREVLNDYFRDPANNPFERNDTELVTVDVRSVLLLSGNTWQVSWREQARSLNGTPKGPPVEYRASLIVEREIDIGRDCRMGNPLGIGVSQLSWTSVRS